MNSRWNGDVSATYDDKWTRMTEAGIDPHGEVALVQRFAPRSVLDAGCGTGRVAIELDRRGVDVAGVDVDAAMLGVAEAKAPHLPWLCADLADFVIADSGSSPESGRGAALRQFDVAVLAGNVMIFVNSGTEAAVLERTAGHVVPGGRVICGFQLGRGWSIEDHDRAAASVGLSGEHRFATWQGEPWTRPVAMWLRSTAVP